ncbi:PREDICTED: protein inturned [Ceratosolen solmsi marchali]|uniref:Protein inturned n=1 Tax=Ceratosolen solmsi marchali TaxID=326594 RepID=A0AAJ6VKW6_9HYME|nr:PREDICTED: protein inturned [Ceratosolen solmsi marchali]
MNDPKEKAPLYQNDEQSYGYVKNGKNPVDEERECWASDSGSSSGSYYSNASSSVIEWESEISPTGEVFYIESLMESFAALNSNKAREDNHYASSPPELTRRRSTRAGKLIRLLKRRESYRHSVRMSGLASELRQNHESISKMHRERENFIRDDYKMGEKYSVNIWVEPEKRHKLGRRATACEAYLGIIPCVASDKSKIIVAGFVPDGEALKTKEINVGDWLQSINSKDVNKYTINTILSRIVSPTNIHCQFQRTCLDGNYENYPATMSCPNQSVLARQLTDKEESTILMESLIKESLGVIFIKTKEFSEGESDMQGVLYSFPRTKTKSTQSFLSITKGAFITLNHMLPDIVGAQPISTTVSTSTGLTHIIYFSYKDELLLIAVPDKCCNKQEAMEHSMDIVCTLSFMNESILTCFEKEENHLHLDHFFYLFFSRLYKDKVVASKANSENLKTNVNIDDLSKYDFSFLLPIVNLVQLPRDAQIQIDAALSEMEAMDYRDWNQDPMECQRLYTIIGSCLYHRRHLLGSHLPAEDLIQIHSFLRRHGILHLINSEDVKSLVIWNKVYPSSSVNRKLQWQDESAYSLTYRWFLLIVGYGHNLLAVILESGGCTAILEEHSGPDIFYVEEAQETLKHIRKIGISALAEKWINANAKPEIIVPQKETTLSKLSSPSIAENIVGFMKTNQSKSISSLNHNVTKVPYDNISMTKSRVSEESRVDFNAGYSLEASRDSPSQDSLSQVSEMSDQAAPILGRRATRERSNALLTRYSDDSDSDLDNDQTGISEISNIRENLLHQAEYIVPKIVTTGNKNSLVYYVHIDLFEGVLISSRVNELDSEFLSNLNGCAQMIHKLLSDTKRYKKLLTHDAGKSVINKSLIAIKEHGILLEWENCTYWIVGRLYNSPRPKELYICYQDCAPQNLIEMAFRLQSTNH